MRKEFYRHRLPHFQQSGQAYFVTWSLKDAIPKNALKRYSDQLEFIQSNIRRLQNKSHKMSGLETAPPSGPADSDPPTLNQFKKQYYYLRKKYIKAYNDMLDNANTPSVDLSEPENTKILIDTLLFWDRKKLKNFAFCIMSNHIHWVFHLNFSDEKEKPVYLQDIMNSVKRFSANQINQKKNRKGSLWQKESFDITIRNIEHLYNAVEYTLNNPVNACLVEKWEDWPGNFLSENF